MTDPGCSVSTSICDILTSPTVEQCVDAYVTVTVANEIGHLMLISSELTTYETTAVDPIRNCGPISQMLCLPGGWTVVDLRLARDKESYKTE